MQEQSQLLTNFYRAYLAWAEKGAVNHKPFEVHTGLCSALDDYLTCVEFYFDSLEYCRAKMELEEQFKSANLDIYFPFNNGDFSEYRSERESYKNEMRMQWVRDHAKLDEL